MIKPKPTDLRYLQHKPHKSGGRQVGQYEAYEPKTLAMFTHNNMVHRNDTRLAMEMLGGSLEREKCSLRVPEKVGIKNRNLDQAKPLF
jgi:hypothetical protein